MCDALMIVPGGLPLPQLRGRIRRYFDERYGSQFLVFLFIPSGSRCYARIKKVLPRERNSSTIRTVERTYEFDISIGMGNDIMVVPA